MLILTRSPASTFTPVPVQVHVRPTRTHLLTWVVGALRCYCSTVQETFSFYDQRRGSEIEDMIGDASPGHADPFTFLRARNSLRVSNLGHPNIAHTFFSLVKIESRTRTTREIYPGCLVLPTAEHVIVPGSCNSAIDTLWSSPRSTPAGLTGDAWKKERQTKVPSEWEFLRYACLLEPGGGAGRVIHGAIDPQSSV